MFSIQSTSSWDKEPHDVNSTVTATVALDENGLIKLDSSGQPVFKVPRLLIGKRCGAQASRRPVSSWLFFNVVASRWRHAMMGC